jgi:hypothetical protein
MKTCKYCNNSKEFGEFNKSRAAADGLQTYCRVCSSAIGKKHYVDNIDKVKLNSSIYYQANADKVKRQTLAWSRAHPESIRNWTLLHPESSNNWHKAHPESAKVSSKLWRQSNPHKTSINSRLRYSLLSRAVPSWYETDLIRTVYLKRDELNIRYGIALAVDHIIPINPRDESVCGLHCWSNLQLLDSSLNQSKKDTYQHDW